MWMQLCHSKVGCSQASLRLCFTTQGCLPCCPPDVHEQWLAWWQDNTDVHQQWLAWWQDNTDVHQQWLAWWQDNTDGRGRQSGGRINKTAERRCQQG
jgi:hypothetical protein